MAQLPTGPKTLVMCSVAELGAGFPSVDGQAVCKSCMYALLNPALHHGCFNDRKYQMSNDEFIVVAAVAALRLSLVPSAGSECILSETHRIAFPRWCRLAHAVGP